MSMRMTNITAALARPQLLVLPAKLALWERHAGILRAALDACPHTRCRMQPSQEVVAWSSIQIQFDDFSPAMIEDVIGRLASRGIPLAWFGGPWKGFTSTLKDWKFACHDGMQSEKSLAPMLLKLVDLPLY